MTKIDILSVDFTSCKPHARLGRTFYQSWKFLQLSTFFTFCSMHFAFLCIMERTSCFELRCIIYVGYNYIVTLTAGSCVRCSVNRREVRTARRLSSVLRWCWSVSSSSSSSASYLKPSSNSTPSTSSPHRERWRRRTDCGCRSAATCATCSS